MEVSLYQVPLMCLREKIAAYKTLFDKDPKLEVSGTFRNEKDELVLLSSGPDPKFYHADPRDTKSKYLTVVYDDEYVKMTPVGNVIGAIRLS